MKYGRSPVQDAYDDYALAQHLLRVWERDSDEEVLSEINKDSERQSDESHCEIADSANSIEATHFH